MKIHILVLFGGESSEHEVSIASAKNIYAAIDILKYDLSLCYIDRAGIWWAVSGMSPEDILRPEVRLIPNLGEASFAVSTGETIRPHVILPVLHGKNGEDGAVVALSQLMHIPVVGCDMTSGALAMDKVLTKQIAAQHGIPVVPYMSVRRGEAFTASNITTQLGGVLFVKPARAGSSVGVTKATGPDKLKAAVETAYRYDDVVLIEQAVRGREIELAVLGNPPHHRVSLPGEITPDREFYDYESKYDSSSTSTVTIPAELSHEVTEKLRSYALESYAALDCSGLARVDFFVTEDEGIYLNEINTFPGFTDISMYPKLWQQAGLGYDTLIDELITLALD